MGAIAKPALQELATIVNEAENTKQAIIKTAEFDTRYKKAKELQEQFVEEEAKEENFEFRPEDVQTLVSRNEFKERYVVRDEDKIKIEKQDGEVIQFRPNEKEDKEK